MRWWCLTGRASFITSSSSLSSTACSKGKLITSRTALCSQSPHNAACWFSVHAGSRTAAWRCCGRAPRWPISSSSSQEWLSVSGTYAKALIHHIIIHVVCGFFFFFFSMNDGLVPAGKYGSNIRPAFWRNIPFFLAPFWAASVLFSRPREMPIVTADKVG